MKKKFGLLMLISTGILLGLTGCGAEKLDMNQFVTYEFVGYDGYGTIVSEFDDEKFEEQIVLLSDEDKNIDEDDAHDIVDSSTFSEAIEGEWTDLGSLSNGGKTTFKWSMPDSYKEKIEEKTGVRLVTDDYQVEVEGLKNSEDFDITDYITFTVEGIAPNAELTVVKSYELKDWPKFSCNKRTNLSNGDVVEITIGKSEDEFNEFRKVNCLPDFERTITYTVEGAPERITSVDGISDELLAVLKNDSKIIMDQYSGYKDNSLYAMGFCLSEDGSSDLIMMIYKVHVKIGYERDEFFPVVYKSLTNSVDTEEVESHRDSGMDIFWNNESYKTIESLKEQYMNDGELQIVEL